MTWVGGESESTLVEVELPAWQLFTVVGQPGQFDKLSPGSVVLDANNTPLLISSVSEDRGVLTFSVLPKGHRKIADALGWRLEIAVPDTSDILEQGTSPTEIELSQEVGSNLRRKL